MKSSRSRPADENAAPLPSDLEDALRSARPRLGRLGSTVLYFPCVGSTNDVASAWAARADSEGVVVLAEEQRSGRGRRGRSWFSPPGAGLYVSIVVDPGRSRDAVRATGLLTLTVGVALAESIETATGLVVHLKWPNDLYVGRRKLGGILAEAVSGERTPAPVVVGYGINLRTAAYPPELGDRATSLEAELGRHADRAHVLAESIAGVARRYQDLLDGSFDAILDAWRGRAPSAIGACVRWTAASGQEATGVTAGIDAQGALLVRAAGQDHRIIAGELMWE